MTAKQKKALAALITSPTIETAAKAAGVGYTTLRRWLKDDEDFRREYERELAGLVTDAAAKAKQSMVPAVLVLRKILVHGSSETARITAARSLLEYGLKLVELADLTARLDALEKNLEEYNNA